MIVTNYKMARILQEPWTKKEIKSKNKITLNKAAIYMWPNFAEVGECVLLKSEIRKDNINIDFMKTIYGDNTGIEAMINHIHIEDIIPEFHSLQRDSFRFALLLLELWEAKLKKDFPQRSFVLILSSIKNQNVIRVHTLRENEKSWIDLRNLDNYMDAILVKIIESK